MDKVEDGRITETIAFHFDNEEQQRRFHDRLNDPNDWKAIATSLRSELARKEAALREIALRTNAYRGAFEEWPLVAGVNEVANKSLQPSSSEVQS